MGGFPAAPGFTGGAHLPGAGHLPAMGHLPGVPAGFVPGGFGGAIHQRGPAWAGGVPGAAGYWAFNHVHPWYNGSWHNHWNGNGFGGYWGGWYPGGWIYPIGWGLSPGVPGSIWYDSGYMSYNNPYYNSAYSGWNYSQPIPMSAAPVAANGIAAPPPAELADAGNPAVDEAVQLFRAADYAGALSKIDTAIRAQPTDAAAHELRALILFAMFDYPQAAATIHSVLAVGPGWDWTTLSSIYSDIAIYESQLQDLEAYAAEHPERADAHFLLAYHYLTAGHTADAAAQLRQVVKLMPSDKLAGQLLAMASGGHAAPAGVPPVAGAPPVAGRPAPGPDVPVDPAALFGSWHASRGDGANFDLTLARDKTFTWNYAPQQQPPQMVTGTYSVDNGLLILQGTTNGAMVGHVTAPGGDRFSFKPLGGPPDDPGLTFTR